MKETWCDVFGYEGLYQVSNLGRVKALEKRIDSGKCHRTWKEHFLAFAIDRKGYFRVSLSKNGCSKTYKVHRLVAEAFIPNPNLLPQVNHIDGNKENNVVDNLEWCSQSENMLHAYAHGLNQNNGENNPAAKLTVKDVQWIRNNYKNRHSEFGAVPMAEKFGVHRKTILRIVNGKQWKGGDEDVKRKIISASG